MMPLTLQLCLIAAAIISHATAVLPITVEGNKFYQLEQDWTQPPESFTIVGVNYQPGGTADFDINGKSDVLSNAQICQRDSFLMRQLGINTIRVSAASPWINHDQCMTILNNAGIYVMLDVNLPDSNLDPANPAGTYTHDYLNNAFGLVDAFKDYPNFLGFIAGDNIVNSTATAQTDPPYVRAVVRDLKQYIGRWANRTIPVGYAAGKDSAWRYAMYEYMQCDASTGNSTADALSRADFIGIDDFSWCGDADWEASDYQSVLEQYNQTSVPVFLSRYGCNAKSPRTFNEVDEGIYGPLGDVLSGGFVYEYSDESNYGLLKIDEQENVSLKQDFENFKTAVAAITYTPVTLSVTGTAALAAAPTCNPKLVNNNAFNWDMSLPPCPAADLILTNGGNLNVGKLQNFPSAELTYTWELMGVNGTTLSPSYTYDSSYQVNYQTNVPASASKTVLPYGSTLSTAEPASTSSDSTTSPSSTGSAASPSTSSGTLSLTASSLTNDQSGKKSPSNGSNKVVNSYTLLFFSTALASVLLVLV